MKKLVSSLLFAALALCGIPLAVEAQVTPRNLTVLSLSATSVATSTTAVVTSQAFTLKAGSGFAVVPNFQLSGSDTANVTFNFQVSLDGVTWTTTTPFTYAVASTGVTPVIGFANFPPGVAGNGADNIAYVRLASVTNASSSRTVTINSVTITRNN